MNDTALQQNVVYLLHFAAPLGNPHSAKGQARHYIGWASDLLARLADHRNQRGAAITRAAVQRGIAFEIVRTWHGSRQLERKLKNRGNAPVFCPICNPRAWHRNAPACAAEQLEIDIDPFELVAIPDQSSPPDWYEISTRRAWSGFYGSEPGDTSMCDLPY